ncbi:MAG: Gfo/Idh/MocA family oxidoreductase [Caldilineaceae bacterium]|nr:Gfo/Idh/MocA family oxidoreductase [Caldilineaceae bacterium]
MTSKEGLRVGFIGTGWTERVQIPAFRLGGLTAQAIASGREENAHRVAQALEIPDTHASWRELITSDAVDIVSIATPPALHREIAVAALEAGKHVICEKPTAMNVAEAEAMLAAAQAAPQQLAIIDHELRFHPQRMQMRQMIKDGFVGTPISVRLTRLGPDRLDRNREWNWWSDAEQGGGTLGALGSHLLDLSRWMFGRIDLLTAQLTTGRLYRMDPATGGERRVTADDEARLLLRFANDAQGEITVSSITAGGYGMAVEVNGTRGALYLDNQDRLWSMTEAEIAAGEWQPVRVIMPNSELLRQLPNQSPFTIGSFYLAQTLAMSLPMGETVLPDAASFFDGLAVQRLLDAARRTDAERSWARL